MHEWLALTLSKINFTFFKWNEKPKNCKIKMRQKKLKLKHSTTIDIDKTETVNEKKKKYEKQALIHRKDCRIIKPK